MGGKNPCIVMDDVGIRGRRRPCRRRRLLEHGRELLGDPAVHRPPRRQATPSSATSRPRSRRKVGESARPGELRRPLVSPEHFAKVRSFLGNGETVLHGGEITDGRYVHLTIIEVPVNDARPAREVRDSARSSPTSRSTALKGSRRHRQRHRLRPAASSFTANGARAMRQLRPRRHRHGELLRRGRHHHAVWRLPPVGLRRPRDNPGPRPRPVTQLRPSGLDLRRRKFLNPTFRGLTENECTIISDILTPSHACDDGPFAGV